MLGIPLTLRQANAFVLAHHRHSAPTRGCRFAVGCQLGGKLVGVAIAGRPAARMLDDGRTLEILRVCTDGTRNACSWLYRRAVQIARLFGYAAVLTYTLAAESGASLRAVGARQVSTVSAREWNRTKRPRRSQPVYAADKIRWIL